MASVPALAAALILLVLIAVADARTRKIPDALLLPMIFFAALYSFLATGAFAVRPALLGGGIFALQWLLSRGAWVGAGDIGLGIGIGFLLGDVPLVLLAVTVAYAFGAIVAVGLLLTKRKKRTDPIAFGPFLAAGGLLSLFFGRELLTALFR